MDAEGAMADADESLVRLERLWRGSPASESVDGSIISEDSCCCCCCCCCCCGSCGEERKAAKLALLVAREGRARVASSTDEWIDDG